MKEEKDVLGDYFRKIKAERKAKDFEEYAEIIIFENNALKCLRSLEKEGFIIKDSDFDLDFEAEKFKRLEHRLVIPDFQIQKEDVQFLIYLLVKETSTTIEKLDLVMYNTTLNLLSEISGVILVWPKKNFLSKYLSYHDINVLIKRVEKSVNFREQELSDLSRTILEAFKEQFVTCEIPTEEILRFPRKERVFIPVDQILKEKVGLKFDKLMQKRLVLEEKKEAVKRINKKNLSSFIEGILQILETIDKVKVDRERIEKAIRL